MEPQRERKRAPGDDEDGTRAARKRTKVEGTLRMLPTTGDYFLQHCGEALTDKNLYGRVRELPRNEKDTMALNEVAARQRRAFFFFLPSHQAWKTPVREPLRPASRVPPSPGARYPTLCMMDYVWSATSYVNFMAHGQRARYLKCNAIVNAPAALTPLYPLQYVAHVATPTYATPEPTLVVVATASSYYVLSTKELDAIVGRWVDSEYRTRGTTPQAPDPLLRLDSMPYIFDTHLLNAGNRARYDALQAFLCSDLSEVYSKIVERCRGMTGDIKSTMDGAGLREVIPRAAAPEKGTGLGTPVEAQGVK